MTKKRRYGLWSGYPAGIPENKSRCVEEVYPQHSYISRQCRRKRGHGPGGLYCKQHGEMRMKRPLRPTTLAGGVD